MSENQLPTGAGTDRQSSRRRRSRAIKTRRQPERGPRRGFASWGQTDHNGKTRITQPRTIAAPMNMTNIWAPSLACSRGVSLAIVAKTSDTKNANSEHQAEVAGHLLASEAHVVRVDRDEHVEQAGHDQKRVAVFVGGGGHDALPEIECRSR